jgi:hypothetical protein
LVWCVTKFTTWKIWFVKQILLFTHASRNAPWYPPSFHEFPPFILI